jgi:hypothetical protein
MKDYADFIYPQTTYNAPLMFKSHTEFLQGGNLRYRINTELHHLGITELEMVLELVKMARQTMEDGVARGVIVGL